MGSKDVGSFFSPPGRIFQSERSRIWLLDCSCLNGNIVNNETQAAWNLCHNPYEWNVICNISVILCCIAQSGAPCMLWKFLGDPAIYSKRRDETMYKFGVFSAKKGPVAERYNQRHFSCRMWGSTVSKSKVCDSRNLIWGQLYCLEFLLQPSPRHFTQITLYSGKDRFISTIFHSHDGQLSKGPGFSALDSWIQYCSGVLMNF